MTLALPSILRKTDKGLPRYMDDEESDVFLLSGAEDLVPAPDPVTGKRPVPTRLAGNSYYVYGYRPRVEGHFARIERWTSVDSSEPSFWRTISRDNITTWYGYQAVSRIFDPDDPIRVIQCLICQTNDEKGNVAVYQYVSDEKLGIDTSAVWEANRALAARQANRYLKQILYGIPPPSYLPIRTLEKPEGKLPSDWLFEAVFDYSDHFGEFPTPIADDPPNPEAKFARKSHAGIPLGATWRRGPLLISTQGGPSGTASSGAASGRGEPAASARDFFLELTAPRTAEKFAKSVGKILRDALPGMPL